MSHSHSLYIQCVSVCVCSASFLVCVNWPCDRLRFGATASFLSQRFQNVSYVFSTCLQLSVCTCLFVYLSIRQRWMKSSNSKLFRYSLPFLSPASLLAQTFLYSLTDEMRNSGETRRDTAVLSSHAPLCKVTVTVDDVVGSVNQQRMYSKYPECSRPAGCVQESFQGCSASVSAG